MLTRGLIGLFYLLIILEWILGDKFIGIRYLHFSYLAFYLATTLLFAFLSMRYPKQAFAFLPVLIWVTFHYLQPFLVSHNPDIKPAEKTTSLRILSFSVNSRNRQYQAVSQLLRQHPADLVCLQEIPYSRYQRFIREIQKTGLGYHYLYSRKRSLMLLSPHRLTPKKNLPFQQATLHINDTNIRVWNIHSPKSLTRKHYQGDFFKRLKEDIDSDSSRLKLLCGDFNLTPHNDEFTALSRLFHSAFQYQVSPIAFTYPTPTADHHPFPVPVLKIDYIMVNQAFHVDRYVRLAQYAHSDHYPIMAHIRFTRHE